MSQNQLHNSPQSWSLGALSNLGTSHPDYGWGTYDFLTHNISGSRIFVISLASGVMKKLKIDLMSGFGQQFTFTYANLDGSNEITQSISKAAYSAKNFVYFDLTSQQILDREPISNQWDLVVRRYGIEIPYGPSTLFYIVTGVQSNLGINTSEVRGQIASPGDSVNFNLTDSDISRIGSDWKYFNRNTFSYSLVDSLSFFVTSNDGGIYHLYFTGFGGGSNGNLSFTQMPSPCDGLIDSVQTINVAQGVYRVHLNGPLPAATNYTVEWRPDTAATWRSKSFKNAAQPYLNINVTPWFNNSIVARVGVDDGTSLSYSCEHTFTTPCRPMTLQTAQQNAAKCGGDSALVRVGYAGGRGAKTILWSNGATTKRTYAQQGQTLTVTVTDATGCSLTESITASVLANTSTAPTNVSTTRSGTVVTVNWTASTFGAGQTLIGYRVQYRLRGTTTWSQTALTTNITADVDFAGGTPGNYEFTVIARYNDNGTGTTSARACFTVRGVPNTKMGTASGMDNGSAIAIYPNPAHHQVYVAAASGSEVMLMDLGGRILAVQTVDQAELAFDLSGMANGVYMIQIQSKGEVITERVVKQ